MGGKKGGSKAGGSKQHGKAGSMDDADDPTSSQYKVNACIVLAENFDEGCQTETMFGEGTAAAGQSDRITGLLPLPGGTTLLQRTVDLALDTLHMRSVYVLCRQCNTSTVEGALARSKRMTVTGVPDTCTSVCEVLRAFGSGVTQCPLAQQDFLLLRGDSLAQPSIVKPIYDSVLEYHTSRRKAAKSEYLMTRIFVSASVDSTSCDDVLTNIVVGTGGTGEAKGQLSDNLKQQGITIGELLHWSGTESSSSTVGLSEPLLHWGFGATSKFNEIHYRTGVLGDGALGDVFSPDVFRLLEEEADYKSLRDDLVKFTIGAKFDDGVCPFGIGACVVPPLPHQLVRVTSPRTYYEGAVTMMLDKSPRDFLTPWPSHNVESRHLYASKDCRWSTDGNDDDLTKVHGEVAYIDTKASVHPSAELSRCYIAPGATIGAGVEIDSSIIGPGAVVKEGAKLNRCILHADTTVSPSATVEGVVVPPHGSVTSSTVARPVEGVAIGAPLPDTAQALAKLDAARASTVESSGTDEVADNEEEGEDDDGITGSLSGDEAFKQGFRTEVYSFFKEGWEEKQDVSHVCQQLRIYRTTEQVLVSDSNAGKPEQPLVSSFYEYWDDALEELYLTDQAGLPSWWLDTLDALCEYCSQRGGDLHKECCLFIWGMYANDFLSREDLLGWWSRAPDAYQQMPLMAQLVGQIEEESDESDDDDDEEEEEEEEKEEEEESDDDEE
ncbi:hypothetical protein FOL46_005121 [Perkinsus olseni]|uniref:Mannose-1-phosphate guanyltransferase C-terminal domain-containing protein n=1 Tax=Perkinsus olseni TaxID=32597 RepID=A0A7J6LU30_PEROL|nr:hypothetical protein FOL46_005121 [Perkinsus olseni]